MLLSNNDHLSAQMDRITRCLSSFIEEQRAFNQQIEERLSKSLHHNSNDQFQQQIVTQGLLVNLNSAYREIAVLQSEINALHSENTRLTSSISFDQHYHHTSPQKCDPIVRRHPRPPPRTHFNDYGPEETPRSKSYAAEPIKSEKQTPRSTPQQTSNPDRNDEQFDDLSYMLSAISHPYKNIMVGLSDLYVMEETCVLV